MAVPFHDRFQRLSPRTCMGQTILSANPLGSQSFCLVAAIPCWEDPRRAKVQGVVLSSK